VNMDDVKHKPKLLHWIDEYMVDVQYML
jgi:hypothetical protein